MDNRKIIPIQKIRDYINDQPADKKVNMKNSGSMSGRCGCVMVQYAEENLPEYKGKKFTCGYEAIFGEDLQHYKLSEPIYSLIYSDKWDDIQNYGDIQKIIA